VPGQVVKTGWNRDGMKMLAMGVAPDHQASPTESRPDLGLEREKQTADWAAGAACSYDDWKRYLRVLKDQNTAETPTGTAGVEKWRPSMLCWKE